MHFPGKSTLASLLLRLYDPVEGSVIVGGKDIRDIDEFNLRNRIGTVAQVGRRKYYAGVIFISCPSDAFVVIAHLKKIDQSQVGRTLIVRCR